MIQGLEDGHLMQRAIFGRHACRSFVSQSSAAGHMHVRSELLNLRAWIHVCACRFGITAVGQEEWGG